MRKVQVRTKCNRAGDFGVLGRRALVRSAILIILLCILTGLAAAAEALGLNHSTLSRRLAAVEETLGVVLFDRRRSGYTPTSAGAEMVALGDRVEKDVLSSARRVSGHVQGHAGDLRVTTSDALLLDFLTPIIADFLTDNPEIRVEVIVGNKPLNLARGDSDIDQV